jgi:drug/metabolite transporter (DMT)-like permease
MERKNYLKGDLLVVAGLMLFGTYALFLRLLPSIPTLSFLFAFQVMGALTLLITSHPWRRWQSLSRDDWLLLAGIAVAALSNDLLYFLSFRMTSVANASIAHQSVSIFLLFLAPLLIRQWTRREEWIAAGFSLVGIGILYSGGITLKAGQDLLGITLALLSGLCYALIIILYVVLPKRGLKNREINFWRYAISTVMMLPFAPLMGVASLRPQNLLPLAAFGLLFAVIATTIHTSGIGRTRPLHASILGKSEPVFATAYAFLFLHEAPPPQAVIGGILIIGSSIWLALQGHALVSYTPPNTIPSRKPVGHDQL